MYRARGKESVREEIQMIQEMMLSPIFILLDIFLGGIFVAIISYNFYQSFLLALFSFLFFISVFTSLFFFIHKGTKKEKDYSL